ncbi:hypothetical protein [Nioella sp.]|uniref:hypothetical protein n=1 Tax=Nioella sp. TaxID=1912091 RepID=UPI003B525A17
MALRVEHLPGLSGWAPALLHENGNSWLSLPVASGQAEFSIRLPLTEPYVAALRADPARVWIIFGALHARLQSLGPRVGQNLAPDIAVVILPRILGAEDLGRLCSELRAEVPDFDNVIAQASDHSYHAP